MKITRVSPMTGKTNSMELDITQEQYDAWYNGMLIQDAMPHLTADEREFIISGCTADDWDTLFSTGGDEFIYPDNEK